VKEYVASDDINNPMYLQTIASSHDQHQSKQNNYSTVNNTPRRGRPRDPSDLSTSSTCSLLSNRLSFSKDDQMYAVVDAPNSTSVLENVYTYAETAFDGKPQSDSVFRRGKEKTTGRYAYSEANGNTHHKGLNPVTENYEDSVFRSEEAYHELEQLNEQPEYREIHSEMTDPSAELYTTLAQNHENQHNNYAQLTNQNKDSAQNNANSIYGPTEHPGTYAAIQSPTRQETYETLVKPKNKTNMTASDRRDNNEMTSQQETYTTLECVQTPQTETYEQLINNNVGQCNQETYSALNESDCPAQETYEELTNAGKSLGLTGKGVVNPNYESGNDIHHNLTAQ